MIIDVKPDEWLLVTTNLTVRFDCSDPVLNQEAVDIVDRMLPEARVPRVAKSPVLRCFRILRPCQGSQQSASHKSY